MLIKYHKITISVNQLILINYHCINNCMCNMMHLKKKQQPSHSSIANNVRGRSNLVASNKINKNIKCVLTINIGQSMQTSQWNQYSQK